MITFKKLSSEHIHHFTGVTTIESPFAHEDPAVKQLYEDYLNAAAHDCFSRNECPVASHALYTQWLDDDVPEERSLGIGAGLFLAAKCSNLTAVYTDFGMSRGMRQGINAANAAGREVVTRQLNGRWQRIALYLDGYCHGLSGDPIPDEASGYYQFGWGDARSGRPRNWSYCE